MSKMGNVQIDREEHELRDFDHVEESKLDRLAYQTRLRGMWLDPHECCPHIIGQPDSVSLCGADGGSEGRKPCIYEVHRSNGDFCQILRDVLREMHDETPALFGVRVGRGIQEMLPDVRLPCLSPENRQTSEGKENYIGGEILNVPTIKPMLAEGSPVPEANNPGKIWETKYDGARIISYVEGKTYHLQARSGSNKTETFPELLLETKLPAILDGEVIGANGGSFQDSIQRRINRTREISIAAKTNPAKYVAFDILEIDGKNIEHLPLLERKNFLSKVLVETENVEIAPYTEDALSLWNNVIIPQSLEGMVGKDKAGKYQRDVRNWQKVKAWKRNYGRMGSTGETFLVVGYTKGTGWRESTFGALVLGRLEADGSLTYVGAVGTGMTSTGEWLEAVQRGNVKDKDNCGIAGLMSMFSPASCPWSKEPEPATWVKPFAVKIQYLEYTNEGVMRFPSFKGVV